MVDSSQAPVPGATITATNKQTRATRVVVSGENGAYRIPDLEPGRYTVTVELQGFQKSQADDVLVLLGRTADFPATLTVGGLSEVVTVTGDTKTQVDLRSTTVAHNVTAEEFDRMPKTRSFQGIALTSPGVNQGDIEGGFQVNGASGAENSFTVDGVNTNSLLYGSSRQDTQFEYLQEVQVKTGGIAAEYGGALGGVISAVTKSGGNRFSGEGHYYYSGNAISAGPVQRLQLSPLDDTTVLNVQDESQRNNRSEVGGSLGGPIVRDRLFFFGSVSPRFIRRTNDYLFSNGTEPGSIPQSQTVTQTFGKVTYSSRRMQANGSVLWTPAAIDRHPVGLRRHGTAVPEQLAGRERRADPARLRSGSDERERQRRLLSERQLVAERSRRAVLRQLRGHRCLDHDLGHLEHAVDRRRRGSRRTCSSRRAPRTRRACSSPTRIRPTPASCRSTTTTRSTRPVHTC